MNPDYYSNLQKTFQTDLNEAALLCQDTLVKNLYYLDLSHELMNTAWGWLGANLEVEHND